MTPELEVSGLSPRLGKAATHRRGSVTRSWMRFGESPDVASADPELPSTNWKAAQQLLALDIGRTVPPRFLGTRLFFECLAWKVSPAKEAFAVLLCPCACFLSECHLIANIAEVDCCWWSFFSFDVVQPQLV